MRDLAHGTGRFLPTGTKGSALANGQSHMPQMLVLHVMSRYCLRLPIGVIIVTWPTIIQYIAA